MMKSYLIIYKLGLPESTYTGLIAYLMTSKYWARPFNSVWIIKATIDAAKLRDGVRERINPDDKVLVIAISNNDWATSGVSKEVTDWMKNSL